MLLVSLLSAKKANFVNYSREDAKGSKVNDDVDAPDDNSDGAEEEGRHKVHLYVLAHPVHDTKEGDDVGG